MYPQAERAKSKGRTAKKSKIEAYAKQGNWQHRVSREMGHGPELVLKLQPSRGFSEARKFDAERDGKLVNI